jgi:hypothetical protein
VRGVRHYPGHSDSREFHRDPEGLGPRACAHDTSDGRAADFPPRHPSRRVGPEYRGPGRHAQCCSTRARPAPREAPTVNRCSIAGNRCGTGTTRLQCHSREAWGNRQASFREPRRRRSRTFSRKLALTVRVFPDVIGSQSPRSEPRVGGSIWWHIPDRPETSHRRAAISNRVRGLPMLCPTRQGNDAERVLGAVAQALLQTVPSVCKADVAGGEGLDLRLHRGRRRGRKIVVGAEGEARHLSSPIASSLNTAGLRGDPARCRAHPL